MLISILKVSVASTVSIITLFLLTKLMGKKQISHLGYFEYANGITIGSIAAELATELEEPEKPFTAMIVYALITFLSSIITIKSLKVRTIIAGKPYVLMDNGRLIRENFKKAKLDINEFLMICRVAGYYNITQINTAILENNGNISFIPTSDAKPVTSLDLSLSPAQEYPCINIILDGTVSAHALKAAGKDENWLMSRLKEQGYSSAKNIFFAFCDSDGNLVCYSS